MTPEEEVAELDRRRVACNNAGDGPGLRSLLSDDYQHVHTSGTRDTAEEFVAGVVRNKRQVEPRSPDIRLYGDSAVLTGPQVLHLPTPDGGERIMRMWVTQVAHRFESGWKLVSAHATLLPS
jgi:hypothetical protein